MKFNITDINIEYEESGWLGLYQTAITFYIKENGCKYSLEQLNFYHNLERVITSISYRNHENIQIMHRYKPPAFNISIRTGRDDDGSIKFALQVIIRILREWLESLSFCKIIKEIQSSINSRLNSNKGYLDNELTAAKYIVNTASELLTKEERLLVEAGNL